jgi:hypothetical protein
MLCDLRFFLQTTELGRTSNRHPMLELGQAAIQQKAPINDRSWGPNICNLQFKTDRLAYGCGL